MSTHRGRVDDEDARRDRLVQSLDIDSIHPAVLAALRKVPRHLFVPSAMVPRAYEDMALPIGHDQTISQPTIVAIMTHVLELEPSDVVLEIGTGSGYQTAVLAELAREVHSIEIVAPLGREAAALLRNLGYRNVHVRIGDGAEGWPEHAPFDAICVTASAPEVPPELLAELAPGAHLVIPVGQDSASLHEIARRCALESIHLPCRVRSVGARSDSRGMVISRVG